MSQGIESQKAGILAKLKTFANTMVTNLKSWLGIHSPSTVMASVIGAPMALGIAEGIEDKGAAVQKALESIIPKDLDVTPALSSLNKLSDEADAIERHSVDAKVNTHTELSDATITRIASSLRDMLIGALDTRPINVEAHLALEGREVGRGATRYINNQQSIDLNNEMRYAGAMA
jgi:phage-related protein